MVEWRHDATTEPWLRVALLVGSGLLYGAFGLFLGAGLVSLGLVRWTGSRAVRALVVVLALVGGPFSLLYLVPAFADPDGRPSFGVAAGLAGLAALAGAVYLAFATRGRLDPAAATLETPTREFDLGQVTGYRVRRVGPVAFATPSFVRVPIDRLAAATDALDAVVAEAERERPAGRDPNPAVRWVAAGLALLFLAVGAGALVLVDAGIAWYLAVLSWLFAAIFLLVAREG